MRKPPRKRLAAIADPMMPRPMTPTASDFFLFFRRAGVEVAILFLERDGRVEQRADAGGGEDIALGAGCRDPALADEDDALGLGADFLDLGGDEHQRRPPARDLPHAPRRLVAPDQVH